MSLQPALSPWAGHGHRLQRLQTCLRPPSSSFSFSTSATTHGRIRPTITRPPRTQTALHQQPSLAESKVVHDQQVLPPKPTEPPKVSRIFPSDHQDPSRPFYERLDPRHNQRYDPRHDSRFRKINSRRQHYPSSHNGHHQQQQQNWYANWFMHQAFTRRAIFRAFLFGSLVTAGALGIYQAKSSSFSQWHQFQKDFAQARSAFIHNSVSSFRPFSSSSVSASAPQQQKQLKMLTPEQVEIRLAQHQHSYRVMTKEGDKKEKSGQDLILGYSINQVASNNPIEDDLSRHVVRGRDGAIDKVFFGVFDGHGGWCCSQKVARELAPSVSAELDKVKNPADAVAVMEAIENGFLKLDDKIVNETVQKVLEFPSRPLACSSLLPAISGSCALMSFIDVKEKDLYVACTGDSRAVLGVREPTAEGGHAWRAMPLSFDQTGRNRWEVRRMQEEHPGEENTVVMRGRVLGGLEPTRAFGDARYKWTKEIQERVFKLFPSYRQPHRNYHTPPYVTAKPVVRHHKIRPEDRFLVMATDGLWDKLTSDEVVQLVGDLLDGKTGQEQMILDREEIQKYKNKLKALRGPVTGQEDEDEELTPANMAPKGPASQVRQFTFRDHANASTHLVRNALGGGDDDRLAATLSIPSPMSRVYRDDITVTVIFFGQQDTKLALSDAQDEDGLVEIL